MLQLEYRSENGRSGTEHLENSDLTLHPIFKDAFAYLIPQDDRFSNIISGHSPEVLDKGYRSNPSFYVYLDKHQHLQISIVRLSINHVRSPWRRHICTQESPVKRSKPLIGGFAFPTISWYEMEAPENDFFHGTIPDNYQIDRQFFLEVYDLMLMTVASPIHGTTRRARIPILMSPMRCAGAARPAVDSECSLKWQGWCIGLDIPIVEMEPRISVKNIWWTRYVGPAIIEVVIDCLKLYNTQQHLFRSFLRKLDYLLRVCCHNAVSQGPS